MTEAPPTLTPSARARAAIAELEAAGASVTVQTVRSEAGVGRDTAAQAVREWRESAETAAALPEELQALMADAWSRQVQALVAQERAAAQAAQEQAAQARAEAEAAVQAAETARDAALAEVEGLRTEVADLRSRCDRTQGALEAVTAERDRLLGQQGTAPAA
ncbi:DNA-binding protein [Serinibacter salmoneus]|uniref:Fused signal recognition particle receptor n=1 Tax=Serinibacter salmoneus TaxID=556530 RepID=A0A2A9D2X1_9MICO|nr:DNA-binding protein [Serinibacter salmoneus]PFG20731.1 fused signal recognition particle receptor [Serinibacter salmoneus]